MGFFYSKEENINNIDIDDCENNEDNVKIINLDANQNNKHYEYIVFSGGSTKAIAYCGALLALEEYGILYDHNGNLKIKGIAGTSAGSIIAILLAIGYKPQEILELLKVIDLQKLFNDNNGLVRDAYNIVMKYGLCKGEYMLKFFGDAIEKKTGNADYTFEDLYKDKGVNLITVTSNINCSMTIYMHAHNPNKEYSNIPLRVALRMSTGIPVVFEPYKYNNDYFVDGGMLDNYPIHVFDGKYPGDPNARLNLCKPNYKVLGVKILPNDETLNYTLATRYDIKTMYDYITSCVNTMLIENDRRVITPSFWERSVTIITPNYSPSKYMLTDEEKDELIELGKQSTIKFFKEKNIMSLIPQ